MKRKAALFLLCAAMLGAPAAAVLGEVEFSDLDLTAGNQLLFKAAVDLPRFGAYDSLFLSDLTSTEMQQLTFFPEKAAYLASSHQLQIQNRFGVFRTDSNLQNMKPIDLFPSFVNGEEISAGKITPIQASPDGRYLVYTSPTSAAYGNLVLFDQNTAEEYVISKKVELALDEPKTLWSPDSKFLIYSTRGNLYYFSLRQYSEGNVLAEDFRKIDEGSIRSASWGKDNNLYYVARTLVYRIHSSEFFTKTLYAELLKAGKIVGKIPFGFDHSFDGFWISPDGAKILLSKDSRNLFLYYLAAEDFTEGTVKSLPYLYLPRNTRILDVIWSRSDIVTLMAESIIKGEKKTTVYRLTIDESGPLPAFQEQTENGFSGMVLSPQEKQLALLAGDRILLYDYDSWTKRREIIYADPIDVLWIDETSLIVAGRYSTNLVNLTSGTSEVIALSQPGDVGFSEDFKKIFCRVRTSVYQRSLTDTDWSSASSYQVREASQASSSYRVYLEVSSRGSYRNLIMVRNIRGYGTVPLFPPEEIEYESFPLTDEAVDFDNFSHGSRLRAREVALVFNATETIEGLTTILSTLAEYGLKCTFFVNGEAIQRYPDAVKEIAESGHEVGSLFYTYFDMTDVSFNINKEFIKLGLARTEDDYYTATGREVSLLWHAPYYFTTSEIIAASREMNYTYVGRDVDSMDWMTQETSALTPGIYVSASELVERILEKKKPGSIIPVLVGIPEGNRTDYLFQKLDLLINGLVKRGYRIVPVSSLIENAR